MTMTTLGTTPERLRGRWLGLAALTISGLVLGLDITILVTALPTLSAKLNATTDQLQWMSAAYRGEEVRESARHRRQRDCEHSKDGGSGDTQAPARSSSAAARLDTE